MDRIPPKIMVPHFRRTTKNISNIPIEYLVSNAIWSTDMSTSLIYRNGDSLANVLRINKVYLNDFRKAFDKWLNKQNSGFKYFYRTFTLIEYKRTHILVYLNDSHLESVIREYLVNNIHTS